jgi:hypothetical protein
MEAGLKKLEDILKKRTDLRYVGGNQLRKALKGSGVPGEAIAAYLEDSQLHQGNRRVVKRTLVRATARKPLQYKITAMPRSFQADVLFPTFGPEYEFDPDENKGMTCMLVLIDILSRKAFVLPMPNHTIPTILKTYKKFLKMLGVNIHKIQYNIKMIEADDEFSPYEFVDFNHGLNIRVDTGVAQDDHEVGDGDKLGIVDRFCGVLKQNFRNRLEYDHDTEVGDWVSHVKPIVDSYNDTVHSTIKMKPDAAFQLPLDQQMQQNTADNELNAVTDDLITKQYADNLVPGALVHLLVPVPDKDKMSKGKATWTTELYIVGRKSGYQYEVEGAKIRGRGPLKAPRLYKVNEMKLATAAEVKLYKAQQTGAELTSRQLDKQKEKDANAERKLAWQAKMKENKAKKVVRKELDTPANFEEAPPAAATRNIDTRAPVVDEKAAAAAKKAAAAAKKAAAAAKKAAAANAAAAKKAAAGAKKSKPQALPTDPLPNNREEILNLVEWQSHLSESHSKLFDEWFNLFGMTWTPRKALQKKLVEAGITIKDNSYESMKSSFLKYQKFKEEKQKKNK